MSRAFEAGAGDPWGDEFEGAPAELLSIGADDSLGDLFDTGGGEPWLIGVDVELTLYWQAAGVSPGSEFYSPSRYSDLDEMSEEGGWVLEIKSDVPFEDGDYRVDLENTDTTQRYPLDKPGCNSARFGLRQACRPIRGNKVIQFATAAAIRGEYSVILTTPLGDELVVGNPINLVYVPESLQFISLARLPAKVYKIKNPIRRP